MRHGILDFHIRKSALRSDENRDFSMLRKLPELLHGMADILRIFIRDQPEVEVFHKAHGILPLHHRHHLRDDGTLRLLRGRLGDRLPALDLLRGPLLIKLHNGVLRIERNHRMGTELHRLLHDEFHLILLRKPLEQIDICRQLMHLLHEIDVQKHLFFTGHGLCHKPVRIMNLRNRTLIIRPLAVGNQNLLSRLRPKHLPEMPVILPREPHQPRLGIDICFIYKKVMHSTLSHLTFTKSSLL